MACWCSPGMESSTSCVRFSAIPRILAPPCPLRNRRNWLKLERPGSTARSRRWLRFDRSELKEVRLAEVRREISRPQRFAVMNCPDEAMIAQEKLIQRQQDDI